MKIRRNERCPCGSGRKYKNCCGRDLPISYKIVSAGYPKTLPLKVLRLLAEQERRKQEWIRKFGHVGRIVSVEHDGYRWVGVGNKLFHSTQWGTFHEFLISYQLHVFGREWIHDESEKPLAEQHPIVHWYGAVRDFWKHLPPSDDISSALATGPVMAYLRLAYDLYTLAYNLLLQKKLLNRLKNNIQFQGARYETYVAAAFVRAGFQVILEDETDTTTSHCEFNAIHRATGKKYSIEAKSRHRAGFLGQPGTPRPLPTIKAQIDQLLRKALLKRASHDRIVFIDINVPPEDGHVYATDWFKAVAGQVNELERSQAIDNPWPCAFIFFTNHPYHFVGNDTPEPPRAVTFTAINISDFKVPDMSALQRYPAVSQLFDSLLNHESIPHAFDV